jgi:mannose-6-phosphate isomerase
VSALLSIKVVPKPWGRAPLPPPFTAPSAERIGEIWFEPPPALADLLVKHIFTSEALSVQVHPGDADAPGGRGKEECWLVLAAEPGATLGIGFREPVSREAMRKAATDGSIEQLLAWHPVAPGDFFYIPAGTVHAIGIGVHIVEVQQNCDITYRLYDYGRPRELHLDSGIAVASGEPYDSALRQSVTAEGSVLLVDGPHFRLALLDGGVDPVIAGHFAGPLYAVPLAGTLVVAGCRVEPGQCAEAESLADLEIPAGARCLIAQPCS